jgi:hypothetical protein
MNKIFRIISPSSHTRTKPLGSIRLHGLLEERDDSSECRGWRTGETMPLLQIFGAVVGEPDFLLGVLPDERLERQVDGNRRSGDHKRCSSFGTAEDKQLSWPHGEAGSSGFSAVVDAAKDLNAARRKQRFQPMESFRHGIRAFQMNESL